MESSAAMNGGDDDRPRVTAVEVKIAPGDLLDRISVLEIKSVRLCGEGALRNVATELAELRGARDRAIPPSAMLDALVESLREANEALWDLEEIVRDAGADDARFLEAARAIVRANDRRAAVKREINRALGAGFQEEKSYALPERAEARRR